MRYLRICLSARTSTAPNGRVHTEGRKREIWYSPLDGLIGPALKRPYRECSAGSGNMARPAGSSYMISCLSRRRDLRTRSVKRRRLCATRTYQSRRRLGRKMGLMSAPLSSRILRVAHLFARIGGRGYIVPK